MTENITTCHECGMTLISEELTNHVCDLAYKFEHEAGYHIDHQTGTLHYRTKDGMWHKRILPLNALRPPPNSEHPDKTPEDGTESNG